MTHGGREKRIDRRTVDLAGYPDLVVVYLGMRVRRPRGLLYLAGLGPQISKSWKERPDGLLLHEDLIWSLFHPTSVCGSTGGTSTAWSAGRAPSRIGVGGASSSRTRAGLASGMRRTSSVAELRRYISMSRSQQVSRGLRRPSWHADRCSRVGGAQVFPGHTAPNRSFPKSSTTAGRAYRRDRCERQIAFRAIPRSRHANAERPRPQGNSLGASGALTRDGHRPSPPWP